MPLEKPKTLSRSVQRFVREFIMIVVSITCALGLEQAVAKHLHRRSAEQSRRHILQEIQINLEETRRINRQNQEHAEALKRAAQELFKQIRAGVPDSKINDDFMDKFNGIPLGITLPNLRHAAWDVAVANQSATYIDEASLRSFSVIYGSIKDLCASFGSAIEITNLPGITTLLTDLQLRRAKPMEMLQTLNRAITTFQLVGENLAGLEKELGEAGKG